MTTETTKSNGQHRVKCPHCNGLGFWHSDAKEPWGEPAACHCEPCNGTGEMANMKTFDNTRDWQLRRVLQRDGHVFPDFRDGELRAAGRELQDDIDELKWRLAVARRINGRPHGNNTIGILHSLPERLHRAGRLLP